MENQKIINLLNKSDTNSRHFATTKWYVINDLNNAAYGVDQYGNNEPDNIKYETKVLEPNFCDYADAYILITGIIRIVSGDNTTKVALKYCAPFKKCILHINDEHVEKADILDVAMPMYNLIEYSDNYSDSSDEMSQQLLMIMIIIKILHLLQQLQLVVLMLVVHLDQNLLNINLI